MLISFLRVLVLYPVVVFGIRLMGKRQIGELQPTELVITILISNIATLPIEDQSLPLLAGIIPMLTLICCEVLLSRLALNSRKLRRMLSGTPQVIIRDGAIDRGIMHMLRFSLDDLMTALRGSGIFDVSEVQLAIVETNGTVSVYQKPESRPVTCGDLQIRTAAENPPEVLIADGEISAGGMHAAGFSQQRLERLLHAQKLRAEDVFLLTVDGSGIRTLIRKEETPCADR